MSLLYLSQFPKYVLMRQVNRILLRILSYIMSLKVLLNCAGDNITNNNNV